MAAFLVLSLPRSRSAWMAHFLSYAGRRVTHDLATEAESLADYKSKLSLVDGSAETGAVLGWRVLREELPQTKFVVVRRDFREVGSSLAKFGIQPPWNDLLERSVMLDELATQPGVLVVEYEALADPMVCKVLFEHCLELPFDWNWFAKCHRLQIQVDMNSRLQHLHRNHNRLEAFKAEVALRTRELGARCLH